MESGALWDHFEPHRPVHSVDGYAEGKGIITPDFTGLTSLNDGLIKRSIYRENGLLVLFAFICF